MNTYNKSSKKIIYQVQLDIDSWRNKFASILACDECKIRIKIENKVFDIKTYQIAQKVRTENKKEMTIYYPQHFKAINY